MLNHEICTNIMAVLQEELQLHVSRISEKASDERKVLFFATKLLPVIKLIQSGKMPNRMIGDVDATVSADEVCTECP